MSEDIEETVESERFREILTLKKKVLETRDEIDRALVNGAVDQGAAIGLYHRKVRDYVMSVETVLAPANSQPSVYWTDVPIGEFSLPNDTKRNVVGLSEFLELPTTIEVKEEQTRQQSYRHKAETVVQARRVRPPERLIEQAFRVTNQALDAAGFDLDEPSDTEKSGFRQIDDVVKATQILDFLRSLDDDGLREVQQVITDDLLENGQEHTNGHHE